MLYISVTQRQDVIFLNKQTLCLYLHDCHVTELGLTVLVMTTASELWEHQKYLTEGFKEDGDRLCSLVPSGDSWDRVGHRKLTLNKVVKTTLLQGQWALAQVVQRCVGVSFLGDTHKPPGCGPVAPCSVWPYFSRGWTDVPQDVPSSLSCSVMLCTVPCYLISHCQ